MNYDINIPLKNSSVDFRNENVLSKLVESISSLYEDSCGKEAAILIAAEDLENQEGYGIF